MPRVSCILATGNRPAFLTQALAYFERRTLRDAELIVIDDGVVGSEPLIPADSSIRYVRLDRATLLGTKLNVGVELAAGKIIQKLDDDDYYHPRFLEAAVAALTAGSGRPSIAACSRFLVTILGTPGLFDSGPGWFAGGTFCFFRTAWERSPFQDIPRRVDVGFLEDHSELERILLSEPELYMLVRHGANTWNKLVPETVVPVDRILDDNVDAYFRTCERYPRALHEVIGEANALFYERLSEERASAGAPAR